jgi:anti-sigma regulatory factor (Ser/Thr protein kinase)
VSDISGGTVEEDFTIADLGRLRSLVARAAHLVGLTVKAVDDLVLAVNEIAGNAIRYAGGRGRIKIVSWARGIAVEISDRGPGFPAGLVDERPPVGAIGGRGLWMARRLCDRMTVASTDRGVTVRLVAVIH